MGARAWTEAEDEALADGWGGRRPETLGRILGRSAVAVTLRANRIGARGSNPAVFTLRELMALFGTADRRRVDAWVADGLLREGRGAGAHRRRRFAAEEVERFIRRHVPHYDRARVSPGYYRNLAEAAFRRDPWYTVAAAAARLGLHPESIRRRVRKGQLPATRVRGFGASGGDWRIRGSDLAAARPNRNRRRK